MGNAASGRKHSLEGLSEVADENATVLDVAPIAPTDDESKQVPETKQAFSDLHIDIKEDADPLSVTAFHEKPELAVLDTPRTVPSFPVITISPAV